MPVSIVVGGQFGSEGKGKVASWIAKDPSVKIAVRCGGPNSGHTVIHNGKPEIFRQLPTACLNPNVTSVLSAGTYIDPEILFEEIARAEITPDRLFIDPNAVIINERNKREEQTSGLKESIGSTTSGTGAAVISRVKRDCRATLVRDLPEFDPYVRPVTPFLRKTLDLGERIVIEGTQGYGLSLLHSPYYPRVTSRDTTAAGFLSEVGLSPLDVDDVVMVLRAFPIRVPGNSGPLPTEINWGVLKKESGSPEDLTEKTSVTKSNRRVARIDPCLIRQAITVNRPTRIVLNHVDHIDYECRKYEGLTLKAMRFISGLECTIQRNIYHYGAGPDHIDTYGLRSH